MVSAESKAISKTDMEENLALQELIWELFFCTTEHVGKSKPLHEAMTSEQWKNGGPSGPTTDLIQNKR